MKSKKRPSKLPEEWEVIPNTHEGIVTQAQFDTVQRLMTSRRRDKGGKGRFLLFMLTATRLYPTRFPAYTGLRRMALTLLLLH